ncbi:Bardet-Biedl syndrome 7 protein homolog [Neocloeon triangulifer]|uniref:Bardet-Biedl syndrome 7 protein homolog n=1 Tax=Neocloeon triangulifer TaxID=2078957 RepID=UPI00286EFE76|nr:Bardet-Biedl syndrome 7 protein homolog [Neocloeon triangulifer]
MEIPLNRIDYSLVGPTSRHTMKIIPNPEGKGQQKIALGSHDGVVQIFNIKKGNLVHTFKSLPGRKINGLELGGVRDQIQDKIFVASNNEIKGYNKKGKLFLAFETTLTEPIQHMSISGSDLMVATFHSFQHYADCAEKLNATFADKITDIINLPAPNNQPVRTVIACEDRTLRMVTDKKQTVIAEISGRPSTMQLENGDGGLNGIEVLYGAQDGSIGLVSFGFQPLVRWVMESTNGGVNCMTHFDMTGDGQKELIVGRDDGLIEVYAFDEMQELPVKRASYSCSESIVSIQAGFVSSAEYPEIIAVTYTGWFFGLTTESKESIDLRQGDGPTNMSVEMQERLQQLRMEIDDIEQKVMREREKYKQTTQSKPDALSIVPNIEINDKFTLIQNEAVYLLSIEVQTPIDNVLIQSNTPLLILDVERNSAVVSHSASDPESGNHLLVTYRCQVNTTRLEVKVQTTEGRAGELRAYVTVSMQPKCCRLIKYPIKPLSLHQRSHDLALDRPYNSLRLTGEFSLAEVHSWIGLCVPEVPEKVPLTPEGVLSYKNASLNTVLHCVYMKGKAEFKADSMSTIAVLKDILTKEATAKNIELDISCEIHPESTAHMLRLLHPLLATQRQIANDAALLVPLHELKQQGVNLPEQYQLILERELQLTENMKRQPDQLQRLKSMICDLFMDIGKFRSGNARAKVPQLLELLDSYKDIQTLEEFFEQ